MTLWWALAAVAAALALGVGIGVAAAGWERRHWQRKMMNQRRMLVARIEKLEADSRDDDWRRGVDA